MNYFRNLTTANSGESSKRFIAIYCTGLLTVVILCCIFGIDVKAVDTIIYALVSIILGGSAMSLVTRNNSSKSENIGNQSTVMYDKYGTYRPDGISEEEMKI